MQHIIILFPQHIEAVHSLFNTVGQCINRGDEANIPPALIPRRMFLWAPLTHLSRRREGLARSLKSLCAIAVQYYEEETHSTGHVDKEAHGTYRLVGTWKYHWMATFWCGQVNA